MANHMETALEEHRRLIKDLAAMKQDRDATLEREAILKGRIDMLDRELAAAKDRGDHYLRWSVELTKMVHDIGMFVQNALAVARQEVAKQGNGRQADALEAVEKAITGAKETKEPF